MRRTLALAAAATLVGAILFATSPAQGATVDYPSSAPCNTTLQACIDGVSAGSTIRITTNTPIVEDISIDKSLTLRAASGFDAVIAGTDALTPNDFDMDPTGVTAKTIHVSGIEFRHMVVHIDAAGAVSGTHRMTFTNNRVTHMENNNNSDGVDVNLLAPADVIVRGNFVQTTGTPISLLQDSDIGATKVTVEGNRVTTSQDSNAYQGIQSRFQGASLGTANIYSNVIYGLGGCNCGGPTAIEADASDAAVARENIVNNTIVNYQNGPAIDVESSGGSRLTVKVFNNVIADADGGAFDYPVTTAGLKIETRNNNVTDTPTSDVGGYPPTKTLRFPPKFVDPAGDNYRLQSTSRLVGRGLTCQTGGLPRSDAAQRFRLKGLAVDVGAYENGAGRVPAGRNVFGTNGANTLRGTNGADIMCGFGGGDTMRGRGGKDWASGGTGKDKILAGGGKDLVFGDAGRDKMFGGGKADLLIALDGGGGDLADGDAGKDTCRTDPGDTRRSC